MCHVKALSFWAPTFRGMYKNIYAKVLEYNFNNNIDLCRKHNPCTYKALEHLQLYYHNMPQYKRSHNDYSKKQCHQTTNSNKVHICIRVISGVILPFVTNLAQKRPANNGLNPFLYTCISFLIGTTALF